MNSREMDGMGLMHIIGQDMKIKILTNLMRYGGVECVKNTKLQDEHRKIS